MIPNFAINPYVKPFVGGLSEEYGQSVNQRLTNYRQAEEAEDILGYQADTLYNKIGPFENDKRLAGNYLDKVRSDINERVERGDYENLLHSVKRSARKFSAQVEPLLQNKALYDNYIKSLNDRLSTGKIGRDTYQKSIQHSIENYKGFSPENPNSFFSGYTPTDDLSIVDKVRKYTGDTFKGDKTSYEIFDPIKGVKFKVSGETNQEPISYKDSSGKKTFLYFDDATGQYNTEGNGRKINQVELAIRQYIAGDKDISNYVQNQATLGNHKRVNEEAQSAIQSEMQRLGFTDTDNQVHEITPAWMRYRDEQIDINKPAETVNDVTTGNQLLASRSGLKMATNGRMVKDTDYFKANDDGSYNKFYDKNGKQLSVAEFDRLQSLAFAGDDPELHKSLRIEKASPDEIKNLERVHDEELTNIIKNSFLASRQDASPMEGENPKQYQDRQNAILAANQSTWDSPAYRKKIYGELEKADEQFRTITPRLWAQKAFSNVRMIDNMNVTKDEDGNNVLSKNLLGRSLRVLSTDSGIDTEGVLDVNTLIDKMKEENYRFVGSTTDGLMKINPTKMQGAIGNMPASSVTLQFKDNDNNTKYMKVAVGIDASAEKKPKLQFLQNVGTAYLNRQNTFIPYTDTSGRQVAKAGVKVITIPGVEVGSQQPYVAFIQKVDSEGNNDGQPIPLEDWQDQWVNNFAKDEANSFLRNK